jgi:hypothetical protein
MQRVDIVFALLSVVTASSVASYIWIFLYRPAAFRFSQLQSSVWYKRIAGRVYFAVSTLGLGYMLYKSTEAILWWLPRTMVIAGRPLPEIMAIMIGFGTTSLLVMKLEEIAKERSRY